MPSYVALPATPSDIPAIASLVFAANISDPVFSAISPQGGTLSAIDHMINQLEMMMDEDLSVYMMVVKDMAYGEVVGYANWHFILGSNDVILNRRQSFTEQVSGIDEVNRELAVRCLRNSEQKRMDVLSEVLAVGGGGDSDSHSTGYAYISSLGVKPSHQRQGAASKLVEWGVERADDKDLVVYVESTPAALSLYHNFGFQDYDKLLIDLKPRDDEIIEHTCMIRLPNGS